MAQGTAETVTVTEPGTLSEIVNNLPPTRIESLVVKGALNAADIAYLRNGIGKLIKTEALDISEVTLVPGEDSYGSLLVASSDVGFGTTTQHYFISDEYHVETDWESTVPGWNQSQSICILQRPFGGICLVALTTSRLNCLSD